MSRKILPFFLVLAIALSACRFTMDIPVQEVGETEVETINVAVPADSPASVNISYGAGNMAINPGSASLVSGTVTYNIADIKPVVTVDGSVVTIKQGNYQVRGVPNLTGIKNEWDLQLGTAPMQLSIDAGACKAEYELGGLALENLSINDGASDVTVTFSEPNLTEMNTFSYDTGASEVRLKGLANANFTLLQFSSGAGDFTLDFSGELKRSASVTISTGVSNFTLVIPQGIPVQLSLEDSFANVNMPDGWSQNGDTYTQSGEGPSLTIILNIGAGNLTVTH